MLLLLLTLLNTSHTTNFVVFPEDCNPNQILFGGKLLSEMDRCAAITTRRFLYDSEIKDAVTINIDKLIFHKPAKVKDLLFINSTIIEVTKKTIKVYVKVERETKDSKELIADGYFTFCAYDPVTKKAVEHGLKLR